MTVDFKFHPEFYPRDTDKGTDTDFDKVIKDIAKAPGDPSDTIMKFQTECPLYACLDQNIPQSVHKP